MDSVALWQWSNVIQCQIIWLKLITVIKIQVVQGQGLIWGEGGRGMSSTTENEVFNMDCLSKVKALFHFVFYPHIHSSWPFLLIDGVILFLFVDKLHFTVDVSQDLWLGSKAYYGLSVFGQVLYLLIFRISTDGDFLEVSWATQMLCACFVSVPVLSHFMLNVNKPHSLLPSFPLWGFRNRNSHSSCLLCGMSHRKAVASSSVSIHQT